MLFYLFTHKPEHARNYITSNMEFLNVCALTIFRHSFIYCPSDKSTVLISI